MTSIVGLMTLIFPKEGQTVLAKPTDMNSLQDRFSKITVLFVASTTEPILHILFRPHMLKKVVSDANKTVFYEIFKKYQRIDRSSCRIRK